MNTGQTILKNTGVLLLGRVITIILGVVYVAALSRHMQSIGMGIIATATAAVSLANLFLNFGLDDITVRDVAMDKSRRLSYLPNLFFLRGLLVFLFLGIVFAISKWAGYPSTTVNVIYIYCLAYIFDELTSILFAIFTAHERMEFSAALQTGRDLLNFSLSLLAIALNANLYVIVGISAFASLIKFLAGLMVMRWKFSLPKFRIDLSLSRRLVVTTLPFAALLAMSVLTQNISTFILSLFRSEQEVGWYNSANILVNYLLLLPAILVHTIFPVFSKLHTTSQEELKRVYSTAFKFLLVLGLALCFGTIVTAEPIILLIYGPGFEQAADTLRILAFVLFWMIGYANGTLLNATGGQGISTKLGLAGITILVAVSLAVTPRFGPFGAALARILPGALFFIPLTLICHKRLHLSLPYGMALKTLVAALTMAGAVSFALSRQLPLILSVALAPAVYLLMLVVLRVLGSPDYQMILRAFHRKKADEQRELPLPIDYTQEMLK